MNRTKIGYCDFTWNPVTGCTFGCEWCFARGIAERFSRFHAEDGELYRGPFQIDHPERAVYGAPGETFPGGFHPTMYEDRLDEPLRRKKPATIFVCDMGDLFGPEVPDEFRWQVFDTMNMASQHTFLVLTKRAECMCYFARRYAREGDEELLPTNVIVGVSVTNQADADERIPILLDTPAAKRWVSLEPLLGPVDFRGGLGGRQPTYSQHDGEVRCESEGWEPLDWLAVGPLTGRGAAKWHREHPCECCDGSGEEDAEYACSACVGTGQAADAWCNDAIQQAQAAGVKVYDKREGATVRELP